MQLTWPETAGPVVLAADEVHVWAVPLDEGPLPPDESMLSDDERRRAERFRRPELRRRFVAARSGLRMIIGRYLGTPPADVRLVLDPGGKPRLATPDGGQSTLRFNLAHSGELALVAVAEGCDVGVDVERLRPVRRLDDIARRYFSTGEWDAIRAVEPPLRAAAFLRCWTGKEAVLKATGVGLGHPLETFDVSAASPSGGWIELPPRKTAGAVRCWLVPVAPCDTYVGAVACVESQRRVVGYAYGG
jgi:4'-phosphopantetheinyl transferase